MILDRDAYIREAVRQLSDSKVYTKLMHNPMQELISEISTFITYLRGKNLIDNTAFTFYSARLAASFFVTITTPTELWVPLLCIQRTTVHI